MDGTRLELSYLRGDTGADEIQSVVDGVLAELGDPTSEASDAVRVAGIDPADASAASISVREGGQGAEPVLTTIIVGIVVSAGSKVAETLWREVLWPRIRRRLGANVLGEGDSASTRVEQR